MSSQPFREVVVEHGPIVLRLCRSMLPAADAEDVWSETFLAALRACPDLDEDANVAAWLTTIARRKAVDHVRRRDRTPVPSSTATDASVEEAAYEPADADLVAALGELSERQRLAVVLHHVQGYPFRDVAEILGTTPAAARRSAADGMAKLRSAYRKDER